MVRGRINISCYKCDAENGSFWGKNGITKTAAAAKTANFFEMVSIFEFMRVESKKIRKTVLGARARQKIIEVKICNRQTDRQIL